jgi:hypothetical protein
MATENISGDHYQHVIRTVGYPGASARYLDSTYQLETFTTATTGTLINLTQQAMSRFAMQVAETGTVTSWTVVLEGSLNGSNFQELLQHTKAETLNGTILWTGPNLYPVSYLRVRVVAITLGGGTNIQVTLVGMP